MRRRGRHDKPSSAAGVGARLLVRSVRPGRVVLRRSRALGPREGYLPGVPDLSTETAAPLVDPLFETTGSTDEVVHLVCCRDVSWRRAFCGEENDRMVSGSFDRVCSMCVDEAETMRPGWASSPEGNVCPVDGRPCPSAAELDAETSRRSRP